MPFKSEIPKFDIDEDVLWRGVLAYVVIALKYLK